jgi:hypothetical protein
MIISMYITAAGAVSKAYFICPPTVQLVYLCMPLSF